MRGVLNDAISLYFADATLASALVAPWCVGVQGRDGVRRVPGTGGRTDTACGGGAALRAVTVTLVKLVIPVEAVDCKSTIRLQINP